MDGGGTKTHCALFDVEGNLVDLVNWGPTNHEVLKNGFDELRSELKELISYLLGRNRIHKSLLENSVFGLAGVDTKRQLKIISGIIKELGIKEFILCNDAYLGIKAGCEKGYGICANSGTGCTIAGIDSSGEMAQNGGMGYFKEDIGGGYYMGEKVISSVYNSLFKDGCHTYMEGLFFSMLGINSKYDFIKTTNEAIDEGKFLIQDFNKIVFAAANRGDKLALDMLDHIGAENASTINRAIRSLKFDNCPCIEIVLTGSVYVKGENKTIVERIRNDVLLGNPDKDIDLKFLGIPPVAGAIVWALDKFNHEKMLYAKVIDAFGCSRKFGGLKLFVDENTKENTIL